MFDFLPSYDFTILGGFYNIIIFKEIREFTCGYILGQCELGISFSGLVEFLSMYDFTDFAKNCENHNFSCG